MSKKTVEARIVQTAMLRRRINSFEELADRAGIEPGTLRKNMREPKGISLLRLRSIVEASGMTDAEIAMLVRAR